MTDKKNPSIDIITVVKDSAREIKFNIANIKNLQKQNDQISWIVIDGRSQDGTTEILKKSDIKKIKHIISDDAGIYQAMNVGLSHVTSNFFIFLNAGDVLLEAAPPLTAGKINCFKSNWHDLLGCDVPRLDFYAPVIGKLMSHQGMFFDREFRSLQYDTRLSVSADMELKCRALKKGVCKMHNIFAVSSLIGGVSQVNLSPRSYLERLRQIFLAQRNSVGLLSRVLTIGFYTLYLAKRIRLRTPKK